MWDWTSFASGLLGAVLGAAVCAGLLALTLSRTDRRQGQLRAIENINAEARELSRIREDNPPDAGVALQPETVRQMSRATAAVSALSSNLRDRDSAVATWALGKLVALVNAETPAQRFGLVTVLNSTLAGWAAGRIETAWFERENLAAEEATSAPVRAAAAGVPPRIEATLTEATVSEAMPESAGSSVDGPSAELRGASSNGGSSGAGAVAVPRRRRTTSSTD